MAPIDLKFLTDWPSDRSRVLRHPAMARHPREQDLEILRPGLVWVATSGSSRAGGRWVGLSRESLLASARAVSEHLRSDAKDVWLNVLPTFHVGGLGILVRGWLSGAKVIDEGHRRWEVGAFMDFLRRHQVTLSALVPTQVFDLVQARQKGPTSLRAIVVGGGALSEELYRAARDLGWPLLPSYGLTECSSQVATAEVESLKTLPQSSPALKILSHVEAEVDSDGILRLRSRALLSAYAEWDGSQWVLTDPKVDGWLTTEDRVDLQSGYLRPLGRIDRRVKVRGELINLVRLEALLERRRMEHATKTEAVILPTPDPRLGNRLSLVVAGNSLEAGEDLLQSINQQVAAFERLESLYLVPQLPRGALGKVQIPILRNLLGL